MRVAAVVVLVAATGLVGCSSDARRGQAVTSSTTRALPSTTSTTAPKPLPDAPPSRRRVEIRAIRLPPGDSFEIDLHPNAEPIRLTVDGGASVCPGRLEWPSWTGFTQCRILAGDGTPIELPSTGTGGFHVGVRFAGVGRTMANVRRVVIDYVAADRFFEIQTGAFAPEDVSVTFTPSFATVGASVVDPAAPGAHVRLQQDGRELPFDDRAAGQGLLQSAHSTSAARPGRPITASLRGTTRRTVSMLLEWN
jgi:hypothetical protein